jgi:hypothetical protein
LIRADDKKQPTASVRICTIKVERPRRSKLIQGIDRSRRSIKREPTPTFVIGSRSRSGSDLLLVGSRHQQTTKQESCSRRRSTLEETPKRPTTTTGACSSRHRLDRRQEATYCICDRLRRPTRVNVWRKASTTVLIQGAQAVDRG